MVFDIEKHQENRLRFLAALLEAGGQEYEKAIGQKAELSAEDTDRICIEMFDEQLVMGETGAPGRGPRLTLTSSGLALIERHLYDKSTLAKNRKVVAWAKEQGGKAAILGSKEAAKWIWVAWGSAAVIASATAAWAWLKGLFARQ
jgi:hypothetical protein